jgi:hypothetical protein
VIIFYNHNGLPKDIQNNIPDGEIGVTLEKGSGNDINNGICRLQTPSRPKTILLLCLLFGATLSLSRNST